MQHVDDTRQHWHNAAMSDFTQQLREMMSEKGLTITAAAKLIGIDRGNLSRILNGKERVTLDRAERIVNQLGATLSVKVKKTRKISAA
jgi:plasmid maintenance system antidote protein VapI